MRTGWAALAAIVLALSACSGSPSEIADGPSKDPAESIKCTALAPADIAAIAEGVKVTDTELTSGALVPLAVEAQQLGVTQVVAVRVSSPAGEDTAILGTGGEGSVVGPIVAADAFAKMYFTWGEAAQEGSPAGDFLDSLAVSDEAVQVKSCL